MPDLDLFADGGETGAIMRTFDWAASPLGPVAGWPKSLRTCVRIILTSRQAMFVWWGPQLINLYNDAYRAIVGGKHPAALGQPASVVWQEIWEEVGPRAETAMRSNRGTYDEALLLIMQRHGYEEETYYTFSYSPVPNDDGSIGGIICANTDETQRIVDERRLVVLRDLAARTARARTWQDACTAGAEALATEPKDVPFALTYILDDDRRRARLASRSRMDPGHPSAPDEIALPGESPWCIAETLASGEMRIVDLAGTTGLPTGAWPHPPTQAAVLPLHASGESGRAGVLVVGLNPYRKLDAKYRDFLQLIGGQITAAIAHAQAYEDERRRAESLAELDRAKTAFFSNVSHELRTPLTLMLGPMEDGLADRADPLSPGQRERQEMVHRNGQRLLKLVNSLLDFSRIEAGRMRASFEPVDLGQLTADLVSTFRSAIERSGMELRVACGPLGGPVHVDRDMWENIVLNLLSNAFKHTFAGSITVALRRAGDGVELSVADTGVGIAADQVPRVFERFHRVQGARSRTHEGTGIGLALVQELVKLHGGTIALASEPDRGSTFTVRLPLGESHLPRDQVVARRAPGSPTARSTAIVAEALRWLPETHGLPISAAADGDAPASDERGGRVLLAEDNADMRAYIQRLLAPRWQVEAVADGAAALAAARARPPDLVLSDVMMPELDGISLLRELRRDPATRHVPVILLSARAGEEAGIEGLEAGADDYLTKPFSAQELLARVTAHLQLKRQRDQAANEVRQNERLLRLVTDHARVGLAMLDERHRYVFTNPTYAEILGLGNADLVGIGVADLSPAVYEGEIRPSLARAFAGERVSCEIRLPAGDRRLGERTYAVTCEPRLDAAGHRVVMAFADITERKRTEESLRQSSATLQLALVSARMAAWSYDPAADRLVASENLGEVFGLLPGQRISEASAARSLLHPEDVDRHFGEVLAAVRERRRYRSVYRLHRPVDGRLAWFEEHGEPHLQDGRLLMSGVTVDVTQRMEADEAVRRSEAVFRGMVDQSLAGIAETDAEGRFTTVNDRYCLITGHAREELLHLTKQELTHPDDRPRSAELIHRLASEGTSFEVEKRYVRRDGSSVWVHNSVSGVRGRDGRLARMIVVTIDITERRRIEESLRHRTEQFATLLNQAPLGIYVVDADFRLRDVNPIAKPVFGDVPGGTIGRDFDELIHILWEAGVADEVVRIFRETLATGVPFDETERIGQRIDRGIVESYEWRVDRIAQPDGRYGLVCYFRDISRQMAARRSLAQHAEELRRANIELEHFATIASHDLQEPLRMISNYSDLLVRKYGTLVDARGKQYFDYIVAGAVRMRSLIHALLNYSQVGKTGVAAMEIDLRAVVQETIDVLQGQISAKGAGVTLGDLPAIVADPVRIGQLLQNLIANALKFTVPERAPVIRIEARDAGGEWWVGVTDNGIDIPAQAHERIFQIFQRLHRPEEYPGSGIGLATCKRIVEQHGGRIGVESQPGVGSTFWFTLAKQPSVQART